LYAMTCKVHHVRRGHHRCRTRDGRQTGLLEDDAGVGRPGHSSNTLDLLIYCVKHLEIWILSSFLCEQCDENTAPAQWLCRSRLRTQERCNGRGVR
jgi:hypothetical protein